MTDADGQLTLFSFAPLTQAANVNSMTAGDNVSTGGGERCGAAVDGARTVGAIHEGDRGGGASVGQTPLESA